MNNDKLFSWIGLIICGLWAGLFIVPIAGIIIFINILFYFDMPKEGD